MTADSASRRTPIVSALLLLLVLLLFGASSFVAGMVVGGGTGVGLAEPSPSAVASPPSATATPAATPGATPGATPRLITVTCAEPSDAFAVLCETYAQIKGEYVDEVTDEQLVDGAVRGMIEYGLEDPYSGYLPPSEYSEALEDLSGEFSGIGAEVGIENVADPDDTATCTVVTVTCVMVVVAPLDGSPAEAAGLRAGDHILEIDDTSTVGEPLSTLVFRVRGEAGTDVTLTIRRDGEVQEITVTRAVIDLQEVSATLLEPGIGYVRLTTFTDRAPAAFRDALTSLLEQGAQDIVLDLRANPGGYIVAAQAVAGEFLPAGQLIFTVESDDNVGRWVAEGDGVAQAAAIDLVVLVDEGSASASEIVAAALQESGRATIVGEPTFGKNTVQIWNDLPNGGGLRLTTDRWFTPLHNSVADEPAGVQPDILVASQEDAEADVDPQLQRALELLRTS